MTEPKSQFREYLAKRKAEWDALPWYTKRWRRIKSRLWTYRDRVRNAYFALRGWKIE